MGEEGELSGYLKTERDRAAEFANGGIARSMNTQKTATSELRETAILTTAEDVGTPYLLLAQELGCISLRGW